MSERDPGYQTPADPVAAGGRAPVRRAGDHLPAWVWLALGVLIVLALAVIFVLPRLVSEYELPFTPRAPVETIAVAPSASAPLNAVSPFDEAQRARQRKEAQDVLASLLTLQQELDNSGVNLWGQVPYDEAVAFARSGDEHYRTQVFDLATADYQRAEQIFRELSASMPQVFADAVAAGEQALQQGDATAGEQNFSLALQIDAASTEAAAGLERARSLDAVNRLLTQGRELQDAGQLEEARARFEQAVALDPLHQPGKAALEQLQAAISDAEFAALMSQGFAALQNEDPDSAIERFEQALRMRPNSEQAGAALAQTRGELANAQITRHRQRAGESEQAERWEQAVAEYDKVLAIDPNLVFAREGRDYAAKRLQLDKLLEEALASPERLAEPAIYDRAAGVYNAGRNLGEPGPRLQQQLDRLEQLLGAARVPVNVQLLSDSATQVTVYQVGSLGQFAEQTVSLLPGSYVAVGTRPGYRDVRKEFTVGFGHQTEAVTIVCDEPVSTEGR